MISKDVEGGHPTDNPQKPFTTPPLKGKTNAEIYAAHHVGELQGPGCRCDNCQSHLEALAEPKTA